MNKAARGEGRSLCGCVSSQNLVPPRPAGWRRVVVHASKPLPHQLQNWASHCALAHSLHGQYCQSVCPVYSPPLPTPEGEYVGQCEKLSPQVCPGYCAAPPPARAAALQPAHGIEHSTLPFEQHTANSKLQLSRQFLQPADTSRPTRGLF